MEKELGKANKDGICSTKGVDNYFLLDSLQVYLLKWDLI